MNTTIAIPADLRDELKEFGSKSETYADIIARLVKSAKERQFHDLLLDEKDTIPIDTAIARAKKWRA